MTDQRAAIAQLIDTTPESIELPAPLPKTEADVQLLTQAVKCLAAAWSDQKFSMTYDAGRTGQPTDIGAFCTRDGLDHMYTFEPAEFSCSSAVTGGGWEEERILMDITVEGVHPYDTEAVLWAIRNHHTDALAGLGEVEGPARREQA